MTADPVHPLLPCSDCDGPGTYLVGLVTAAQVGRLAASSRKAELATVDRFLERVCACPAALVIEGEAGIGKTTLWWAALEHAATKHGIRVLAAQGSPTEVKYAYTVVADLVRGTLDDGVLESLPTRQRAAVERVLHGGSDGPPTDERVVAAAFLTIIERVGLQSPVLVAIDDTQWLDASSGAVLGYVARRLVGRTGLLATVRTGESATVGEPDWLRLSRPDAIERIRLAPLSLGGVHALISARLGRTLPRPAITRIHEVSGGNPFFAAELAGAVSESSSGIADELPASLAALVRQRIGDCGDETAAVLLAAACAAAPTVELIGRATGTTAANVVELLESVEDRGVVTIDGNRVRFTHPLYATGVYTDSAPSRRRAMHRALAGIVDTPEIKARHLALAATTGDPSTKAALDAAADVVLSKGAPAVAAELLELAIKLDGDTPARRIRAGELHFRAGALDHAGLHVKAGLAALTPGTLRCMGLMLLAAVRGYGDDLPSAIEALVAAAAEAQEPAVRLQALLLLSPAEGLAGNLEKSVEHARAAVELSRDRKSVV